jgi:cytochrome P450
LRSGERVLLSWASANRDEAKFSSPDEINPGRATGEHLAFGRGVHYCPGAALVRGLFVAMVEQVLTTMPSYEVLDEDAVEWFPDITSVYGVCRLPVKFISAAAG